MSLLGAKIGAKQNPYEDDTPSKWAPKNRRGRKYRRAKNGSFVPTPAHIPKMYAPRNGHTHRSANTGYKRIGGKVYKYTECQDPDCGYTSRKAVI